MNAVQDLSVQTFESGTISCRIRRVKLQYTATYQDSQVNNIKILVLNSRNSTK